jgi:hypothetical protein
MRTVAWKALLAKVALVAVGCGGGSGSTILDDCAECGQEHQDVAGESEGETHDHFDRYALLVPADQLQAIEVDPEFVSAGEWEAVDAATQAWFYAVPLLQMPVVVGFSEPDPERPVMRIRRLSGPRPDSKWGVLNGAAYADSSIAIWPDDIQTGEIANTVAHEIGHIFGATHHPDDALSEVPASAVMRTPIRLDLSCITRQDLALLCSRLEGCGETKAVCLKIPGVR